MNGYTKPSAREENPDHIILHVGTNDLISDNSLERVGKSIIDLAKICSMIIEKLQSPVLYRETMNEIARQN